MEDRSDDSDYTLDSANQTILDPNGSRYSYSVKGTEIKITFPDGEVYTCANGVAVGTGAQWDQKDDESRKATALSLATALKKALINGDLDAKSSGETSSMVFVGVIFIGLGIFSAASPKTAFQVSKGWRYKNLEPSEAFLSWTGGYGVVMALIGILIVLLSV